MQLVLEPDEPHHIITLLHTFIISLSSQLTQAFFVDLRSTDQVMIIRVCLQVEDQLLSRLVELHSHQFLQNNCCNFFEYAS